MNQDELVEVRAKITEAEATQMRELAAQLGVPFAILAGAAIRAGLTQDLSKESVCR